VQKLIHQYGRGLIKEDEPLTEIGNFLQGNIPATIREVVERAKLAMVSRHGNTIVEDDLLVIGRGMKKHLDLLNKDRNPPKSDAEILGDALGRVIGTAVMTKQEGIDEKVVQIKRDTAVIKDAVGR